MGNQFEAVGDMADWPENVPGKPTQVLVVGVYHPKRGKAFEMLWTGQFPDLEPAMYWAAKKEMQAVRKGKWMLACRVLWQHDLTPEQALEGLKKTMTPQLDRVLQSYRGGEVDLGPGPMRVVRPDENVAKYVEIADKSGNTIQSFVVPPVKETDDDAPPFAPNDPRPPRR